MSQYFIAPGDGWIKGVTWSLAGQLTAGSITLQVHHNDVTVLTHSISAGVIVKGYKILSEASRISVALGDTITCKIVTSADFVMAPAETWVTADVLLEFPLLDGAQHP